LFSSGLPTQEDPIGLAGGNNLYGFANGDPVNFSDPLGLAAEEKERCRPCIKALAGGIRALRTWQASRRARGAVDKLVDASAATGRAAQRLPRPDTPGGISLNDFGTKVMQWGGSSSEARARIGSLTRDELQAAGVTRAIAQKWRDFYVNEVGRVPTNPSARGRAELMHRAMELLP
jgi:hypothetical protein